MSSMIVSFLKGLFVDKAIVDDRQPIWTFQLPFHNNNNNNNTFGLFAPKVTGWIQMIYIQLFHGILQVLVAIVIYKYLIPHRGTMTAYLLGWGIVIPFGLYFPFWFIEFFDIQNHFVNLPAGTAMTCIVFRCIEAMYGTTQPSYIEDSLWNYCIYYSTLSPLIWNDKTRTVQRVRLHDMMQLMQEIALYFVLVSILLSFVMSFEDFKIFSSSNIQYDEWTTIFDPNLYTLSHLGNSYVHAWLLFCTLKVGFELSGLSDNLKTLATRKVFDRPFLESKSPTEFWTKRWNTMIQTILKGGIFLPAKQQLVPTTKLAVFLTFLASGLYHDYIWQCIFYNVPSKYDDTTGNCIAANDCYQAKFGRVTAFFMYIGMIIMLERPIQQSKLLQPMLQWMSKHLPTFVIAQLLLLIHLPFVYWYGGDWIMGGWFHHFSIALFHIRRI